MKINKKLKNVNELNRIDVIILVTLFAISFISKLYSLGYPIMADSNYYLKGAENIYDKAGYNTDEFKTKYPPMYSLGTAIFMPFFHNPVVALKISTFVWSSLIIVVIYIFARKTGMRAPDSLIISSMVLFNPWMFYFTGILSLSESLATLLMLCAALFFYIRKNSTYLSVISGLFFSLSILTRYPMIFFAVPFGTFSLYQILKGKNVKQNIGFAMAAAIPFMLWIVPQLLTQGFGAYGSEISERSSSTFNLWNIAISIFKYLFVVYPLALLMISPFTVLGVRRIITNKHTFWILVVAGMALNLVFYSIWWGKNPSLIVRFVIPTLPLLYLLGCAEINKMKKNTKIIINCLAIILLISSTLLLNVGQVKETADKIVELPPIYTQKSMYKEDAVTWSNENLPVNSNITAFFDQVDTQINMGAYFGKMFRKDITYYMASEDKKQPGIYEGEYLDDFRGKGIYIMSELDDNLTNENLERLGIKNKPIAVEQFGNVKIYFVKS